MQPTTFSHASNPLTDLALYIHWPWCLHKCPYCDFNSHVAATIPEQDYVAVAQQEMSSLANKVSKHSLTSIFFGGGTPSLMSPQSLQALLNHAQKLFGFDPHIEITLEANPSSAEAQKFKDYAACGVNRLSIGVQSLQEVWLKKLGRQHSVGGALKAIEQAQHAVNNVSLDLIYGLDGQNPTDWAHDLEAAAGLGTQHLSAYQLTIEPNTVFYSQHKRGKLKLPNDDLQAAFYDVTNQILADRGFDQYEISNYARNGHISRHNHHIWRYGGYMGVGAGAHGRIFTKDAGWVATRCKKMPQAYMTAVSERGHGLQDERPLSAEERAIEAILMGLRLNEGLHLPTLTTQTGLSFTQMFSSAAVADFVAQGLLHHNAENLHLTDQGRLLLNAILQRVLQPQLIEII